MRKALRTIAFKGFGLLVLLTAACLARAQDAKTPYPGIAPLEQYLMERNAEIALARSAAAQPITADADVMVLGKHGYETVVRGKTASCAWCSALGLPALTTPNSGIPSSGPPSASTRRVPGPTFR